MGKVKERYEEIKELLAECELEHLELHRSEADINSNYIGIDNNAYAYWLCHTDLDGNLQDLLENIQLYGGIK